VSAGGQTREPWWRSSIWTVALGFAALISFYLLTEHTAHVFGALPYLLLLACPLMHLFMHHGSHDHGARKDQP
jgi:hypothetical protein